jgi:FkbM family methyltransferase
MMEHLEMLIKSIEVKGPNGRRQFHFRPGTSDEGTINQIFHHQGYAVRRLRRAHDIFGLIDSQAAIGRRPLIVDAGANIGASAVFFSLTFPTAVTVAIEPEEKNFALLRKNIEGLDVRCVRAGLSSSRGRVKVTDPGEGHWGFRTEATAEESGIPCVTVPDIYAQLCGNAVFPFIVKIDIEGAESDVFSKDTDWLAQTPLVILEPHDWLLPKAGTSRGFLQCIAAQPRDFIIVNDNIFSIAHAFDQEPALSAGRSFEAGGGPPIDHTSSLIRF